MKYHFEPFATRKFEVYPGGYRRLADTTTEFDPGLPCFPAPPEPLMQNYHCEVVLHGHRPALIVIRFGDEQRLLGMRQIAAWGEVVAVSHFGGAGVDVVLRGDNPTPPDFAVLARKWPFGPVRVHADERMGIYRSNVDLTYSVGERLMQDVLAHADAIGQPYT